MQQQPTVKFVPIDQQQKLHPAMVPVEAVGSSARRETSNMVIFIVDRSGSMGSCIGQVVMPACKGFLAEVRPDDAAIVFFNHGADVVPNVTVGRFEYQVRDYAFANGGTQIERDAVTLAVKKAEEAKRKGSDLFVHFVLMTDGQNEAGYKKQAFGNVMEIERQRLSIMTNLSSYLSAVNIGMYADTECAMFAHQALTNTSATDPLSRAGTSRDISNVVKKLSADGARFSNSRNVEIKLQLSSEDLLFKVGFLSNPGLVPSKTFRAVGNST
jgi:methionine synthase I (cobalamin-dependent)